MEASGPEKHEPRWRRVVATVVALVAFSGAAYLLYSALNPPRVAANFTRVGGVTRIDTAVEAARFWLKPPSAVYLTPATAPREVMLNAAKCAMAHDAPLLFTSERGTASQRKVVRMLGRWRTDLLNQGRSRRLLVRRVGTDDSCDFSGTANTTGLWALKGNETLVHDIVPLRARDELASDVVFTVSKPPRKPADISVALALASHLATSDRDVSIVIVPRHFAADPDLDEQLRERAELVSRGVVVGGEKSVSEDTRLVLRQILRSTDRASVVERLRTASGDFGLLIAALAAFFVGTKEATKAASPIDQTVRFVKEKVLMRPASGQPEKTGNEGDEGKQGARRTQSTHGSGAEESDKAGDDGQLVTDARRALEMASQRLDAIARAVRNDELKRRATLLGEEVRDVRRRVGDLADDWS